MKKELLLSLVALGLLNLSSCATGYTPLQKQQSPLPAVDETILSTTSRENPSIARNVSIVRSVRREEIPQLQLDAQSVYQRMLNYFTPDTELAPTVSLEQLTAYIDFPAGGVTVSDKQGNNRAELARLKQQLASLVRGSGGKLKSIRLTGFASPDGTTAENERLAGSRAIQFRNYLQKSLNLNAALITIDWAGEDWDGLRRLLAESGKEYKTSALAVLDGTRDPDKRRTQLKALGKGQVYKDIEKTFFARLRRMQLAVECESVAPVSSDAGLTEQAYSNPEKLSLPDLLRTAAVYRPGTEQYREIYEIAAYRYPSCAVAQLNAAAASLALGDKEQARYFLEQVNDDPRSYNNLGVLALMDGDAVKAATYFRQSMPQNPRLARENLRLTETF